MKTFFNSKRGLLIAGLLLIIAISATVPRILMQKSWNFNGGTWQAPKTSMLACPSPLLATSPVDMAKATTILYPGQYRGTDYKPHGGIGFQTSKNDEVTVRLPMEARLVRASRYFEQNEIQYLLEFRHDCGIAYRFDHLLTLTPEFQSLMNELPEPKTDDSRTTDLNTAIFPAGTVVATGVGHPAMQNVGMDFGVYDLRQENSIAQNTAWRAIHQNDLSLAAYGVCWFTLLSESDQAYIKKLEAQYGADYPIERAISDYCPAPAGTTLEHNNGLPTPEQQ